MIVIAANHPSEDRLWFWGWEGLTQDRSKAIQYMDAPWDVVDECKYIFKGWTIFLLGKT